MYDCSQEGVFRKEWIAVGHFVPRSAECSGREACIL
jgi:hypothetical protein